jgi:malate synthase
MNQYVEVGNLKIATVLYDFVNSEVLPESGVEQESFWANFEGLIAELSPENRALLARRDELQQKINQWHLQNKGDYEFDKYKSFLQEIGYLEQKPAEFQINTSNIDDEVALQGGPQLVVPINNPRYAINAANARWGSLYDALYGTDAISDENGAERGKGYNPVRGEKVIAFGKDFLDKAVPLTSGSHKDAVKYEISNKELVVTLNNGETVGLQDATKLVGFNGQLAEPASILLKNNRMHLEIQIDRNNPIGSTDAAGVKDIILESAVTTIMDCEDSVAAVDAEDKVEVYRSWLGLIKGTLTATFQKGSKELVRTLNPNREYQSINGGTISLSGRSLMFIRNVGHLMTSNAIIDQEGNEIPEGIMDGVITSLISKHEIIGNGLYKNSKQGSIYIVKPKMHGSAEAAFANKLFGRIEDLIGLNRNTLKIGVMDEERRTSLNLKACIREVKERIAFINTGFLDRTGDEMHTSMEAGPMIRKGDMKTSQWLTSYEKSNVFAGLDCGLQGHAQIGKGMWAMPDLMADMLEQKIGHLKAGANTAWVPSPTGATLHATHYHLIDPVEVQNGLKKESTDLVDGILQVPVAKNPNWTPEEIQQELDNNAQGILGYVVRWVEQGVGCSKVPDINDIGLMEDRATLRISSQHVANWLHHGIATKEQVVDTLKRMAVVVDEQNAGDVFYRPMAPNFEDSVAFQAASDLIFLGYDQPSGYTEPILHRRRQEAKAKYNPQEVK